MSTSRTVSVRLEAVEQLAHWAKAGSGWLVTARDQKKVGNKNRWMLVLAIPSCDCSCQRHMPIYTHTSLPIPPAAVLTAQIRWLLPDTMVTNR
jgi:hypothetical protein